MTGWLLAAVALAVGFWSYGWQGGVLALSVIVFWLLLQFSRAMRAMRRASESPVGRLRNAVMFQSRLKRGMTMLQIVGQTRSLGQRRPELGDDVWTWTDDGGVGVTLHFERGQLARWTLDRPADGPAEAPVDAPPAPAAPPPAA
ncbi:hypothetical protein [Piscinibacter sakaiensis]|uniref:Glycerate kinase n=1 Tax=Piscinibacter sakaiensis TaxID=1547922 RepID=A0A0K8P0D6_PISS1|nr:hypothetical protein [Piscinibacter sakaiensis]GAP36004.1 hypothetical protein ISF6_1844 [Piscinibacter sakaiensis]